MTRNIQTIVQCLLFSPAIFFSTRLSAQTAESKNASVVDTLKISGAQKLNETTVALRLSNKSGMLVDFYGENIFRLFYDPNGGPLRDPEAQPPAKILVGNPRKAVQDLQLTSSDSAISLTTSKVRVVFDKTSLRLKVFDENNKLVVQALDSFEINTKKSTLKLSEDPGEYFFGGGVQNGRFSHKGKAIAIENQNSWTDGGVASPTPFYWSTKGYGFMWYTFKKGRYDFGAKEQGIVNLSHETSYVDVFFMVDQTPVALLNDFYQLTGYPVLMPKFAFYEGHLNAYNRDFWKKDSSGIPFEDGQRYKESQKENGGVKESLNGEKNNYQFSARAVIDRYKAHDLPLGWILPNDGYGAGYGQTGTLDSNMLNLKSFGDYARNKGVQIGLWTQSDLHPKEGVSALLQRDIEKEVGVAGVRVLKTDVAWVGQGYSFGLNGVADVAEIMTKYGNNARPFIISLDGWAGTQRYAGVWTGDQTGGVWEYIRFHIPTYIGSGLSGQPNITSDMDGIFGGKNAVVNTRDFQWKAFTPMQLNMDGWGANEKYPFALGEPATSINRLYLKLKSALIPYTYSLAKQAVNGMPIMRAMFLDNANEYTLSKATQYQYMYGPNFLVAPVYKNTSADADGNDVRDGIYLPEGKWIDYFSGDMYDGGRIVNNFKVPLWKLPVFVKSGAIIPMTRPNNNVAEIEKGLRIYDLYPDGQSSFTEYDDDGLTQAYKKGEGATTLIESVVKDQSATITVHPTQGSFDGFEKNKATEFHINVTQAPTAIKAEVGNRKVRLKRATSKEDFANASNAYYYDAKPNLNQFATPGSEFAKMVITKNPQLLVKIASTDITANAIELTITGFRFAPENHLLQSTGVLQAPAPGVLDSNRQAFALTPTWNKIPDADYYEIEFKGQLYSTISDTGLLFEDLQPDTVYSFKIRAVNKSGRSDWKTFTAKTKPNPLQFAIQGIIANASTPSQEGQELTNLFDFDETSMWHTKWSAKAVPFDMIIDLRSINQLDKLKYLPRNRGNGILLKGSVSYSLDKMHWNDAGSFTWEPNGIEKEFIFVNHPTARYIKLAVQDGVGGYGSGRELYVFKVPGSETILPGDINNDHRIDNNDLTSYANYTGLRKGDSDFEGYISKGDINNNGRIDAYDISTVATQLNGGVQTNEPDSLSGTLLLVANKSVYQKNDEVEITVKGVNLHGVNALGFALPYNEKVFEFVGIKPLHLASMENFTNDRLHNDGEKVLYPTFVNIGEQKTLSGSSDLFIIKMKAKRKTSFGLKAFHGVLVNAQLNELKF